MQTILDEAHTWFFDGLSHSLDGSLNIELVEGIKADKREIVYFESTAPMGSFYSVQVLPKSKCVQVKFQNTHLFFVHNESYDVGNDELESDEGVLKKVSASSFLSFIKAHTGISSIIEDDFDSYLLWTQDRLFHIASSCPPNISFVDRSPDLSKERVITWSAS